MTNLSDLCYDELTVIFEFIGVNHSYIFAEYIPDVYNKYMGKCNRMYGVFHIDGMDLNLLNTICDNGHYDHCGENHDVDNVEWNTACVFCKKNGIIKLHDVDDARRNTTCAFCEKKAIIKLHDIACCYNDYCNKSWKCDRCDKIAMNGYSLCEDCAHGDCICGVDIAIKEGLDICKSCKTPLCNKCIGCCTMCGENTHINCLNYIHGDDDICDACVRELYISEPTIDPNSWWLSYKK